MVDPVNRRTVSGALQTVLTALRRSHHLVWKEVQYRQLELPS